MRSLEQMQARKLAIFDIDRVLDVEKFRASCEGAPPGWADTVLQHFRDHGDRFVHVEDNSSCVACDMPLRFEWGLVHGHGHCGHCGWPYQLYHFIEMPDGTRERASLLLPAHPDQMRVRDGG